MELKSEEKFYVFGYLYSNSRSKTLVVYCKKLLWIICLTSTGGILQKLPQITILYL